MRLTSVLTPVRLRRTESLKEEDDEFSLCTVNLNCLGYKKKKKWESQASRYTLREFKRKCFLEDI